MMAPTMISNMYPTLTGLYVHNLTYPLNRLIRQVLSLISNLTDEGTKAKKVYVTFYRAGHFQRVKSSTWTLEHGLEITVVYSPSLPSLFYPQILIDANKGKHFTKGKKSLYRWKFYVNCNVCKLLPKKFLNLLQIPIIIYLISEPSRTPHFFFFQSIVVNWCPHSSTHSSVNTL